MSKNPTKHPTSISSEDMEMIKWIIKIIGTAFVVFLMGIIVYIYNTSGAIVYVSDNNTTDVQETEVQKKSVNIIGNIFIVFGMIFIIVVVFLGMYFYFLSDKKKTQGYMTDMKDSDKLKYDVTKSILEKRMGKKK